MGNVMYISIARTAFVLLSLIFLISYSVGTETVPAFWTYLWGAALGLYVNFPFAKSPPTTQKTKDILLDLSTLSDPRIIDLAASGLIDQRLVLPRFLLKELQNPKALEIVKKLEDLPTLHLRYQEIDFPEVQDVGSKVLRLAKLLDADIFSIDQNKAQVTQIEDTRVINLHTLSNALKPLMQRGQFLKIKVQRIGKEEKQGVGYLEDGTMVVVNGGGVYIGEMVRTRVLSVKNTSSGRMIFCNIAEEGEEDLYDDEEC